MAAITMTDAVAVSTNVVRVGLSSEPQHQDPASDGDALNPATWTVRRLDVDAEFNVLGVSGVDATHFDLLIYEPFGPFLVAHRVSSSTLLALDAVTTITTPATADFPGVVDRGVAVPEAQAASRRFGARDIANPPAPDGLDSLAGTFVVGPSGDYVNEEGPALIRKLAFRRLTFKKGSLFWAPSYGLGLGEKDLVPSNLVSLVAEVEKQIEEEPEVDSCDANVIVDPQGILTIQLKIALKPTGQQVSVGYKLVPQNVRF